MWSLDISDDTRVRAYAHYVFPCAIIEGNMKRSKNGRLLKINVIDGDKSEWINNSSIIQQQGNYFVIDKLNYEDIMYEYVYRDCMKQDELVVRVDEIKNSKGNAILNLAITWDDFDYAIVNSRNSFKLGMLNNHVLTRFNKAFITNNAIVQRKERFLKLSRSDNVVSAYISCDGIEWKFIEEHDIGKEDAKCKIGFIAENLGDIDLIEQYDAWLYMNFIQTIYNVNDDGAVWLDYWNFPRKKCRYENGYYNSFLDVYYDEPSEVIELAGNINNYVQWCLDHEYYLAVSLDEYYISGRSHYQKEHFSHHNLIYGLDLDKKEIYVIG